MILTCFCFAEFSSALSTSPKASCHILLPVSDEFIGGDVTQVITYYIRDHDQKIKRCLTKTFNNRCTTSNDSSDLKAFASLIYLERLLLLIPLHVIHVQLQLSDITNATASHVRTFPNDASSHTATSTDDTQNILHLYTASPIAYVDNLTAPVLISIGEDYSRVAPG